MVQATATVDRLSQGRFTPGEGTGENSNEGPKSAVFVGTNANGLITSAKGPAESMKRVIAPFRHAAAKAGNLSPNVAATRVLTIEQLIEVYAPLATDKGGAYMTLQAESDAELFELGSEFDEVFD